jgi:hypothetical protein
MTTLLSGGSPSNPRELPAEWIPPRVAASPSRSQSPHELPTAQRVCRERKVPERHMNRREPRGCDILVLTGARQHLKDFRCGDGAPRPGLRESEPGKRLRGARCRVCTPGGIAGLVARVRSTAVTAAGTAAGIGAAVRPVGNPGTVAFEL